MDKWTSILEHQQYAILDGALATELESRGADLNDPLWSAKTLIENSGDIRDVHYDYFVAGANVATTASYQASVLGFAQYRGLSEAQTRALITTSVRLAQEAREEAHERRGKLLSHMLVAGSVGPYGAFLADGSEYRGDYDLQLDALKDFHRVRIQALVDAGVDLLALETMPQLREIEALLDLLQQDFPNIAAWVSCTLDEVGNLSDGTSLARLCGLINTYQQVIAIGVNCVSPHMVTAALRTMGEHTDKLLLAYPNSGESWDPKTKSWSDKGNSRQELGQLVETWTGDGARIIGGCCRTSPDDISFLSNYCQRFQRSARG